MKTRHWVMLGGLVLLGLLVWGVLSLPSWFWHPLGYCASAGSRKAVEGCKGYNSWSGSFSDIGEITLIGVGVSACLVSWRFYLNHLTCHVTTCKKPALHHVPGTPYRTCALHHPEIPNGEITVEHIHAAHRDASSPSTPKA